MAGYRPKSLDELNSMYDKTMAAEKAIRKGTSLLEKSEESTVMPELTEDIQQITAEVKQSMGLEDEINDFIAKYSPETTDEKKEESRPKPQMTVLVTEQPKANFELSEDKVEAVDEAPVEEREASRIDRSDLMEEYMRIMSDEDDDVPQKKLSRKEKKKLKMKEKKEAEKSAQQEESAEEAPSDSDEGQNDPFEETAEEEFKAPEYVIKFSDTEEPAETPEAAVEATDDFAFPENYTPGWMKEDEEEKRPAKEKKPSNHTALKGLLGVLLAVLILVGTIATVFKTVIPVNTGKEVSDTFYFFTAYKDYPELDIYNGDLVITEKRYTADGDIFAYIDYNQKAFEFGQRSDSITNDDGEVLLVTEKDGSRTLVSRDDCRGILFGTYPTVGKFISILSDNFIVVIAAVAVLSLVIILVFALALRNKSKKDSDSEKDSAEETDSRETEESEAEEVDLFSTIG